jgi:hypothetical protein
VARTFLLLEHGIPSHDTFGRVFSLISPKKFEAAFSHGREILRAGQEQGKEDFASMAPLVEP